MTLLAAGAVGLVAAGVTVAPMPGLAAEPIPDRVWSPLGDPIEGAAARDFAGAAVAMNANGGTVVVGAPYADPNGESSGQVRVLGWADGGGWELRGDPIDGAAAGDQAGTAVAVSADGGTVVVGAPDADANGDSSGQVRVLDWAVDGGWVLRGDPIAGAAAGDQAGTAVAVSADGDTVVVGSPWADPQGWLSGEVRVLGWTEGGGWEVRGDPIPGAGERDFSGTAVAVSADGATVVVGTADNDIDGPLRGEVRVLGWVEDRGWVQRGDLIRGPGSSDLVRDAVAVSADGDTVVVGAYYASPGMEAAGQAWVLGWDEDRGWVQRGDAINGTALNEYVGWAVAVSGDGDTVVVGAPGAYEYEGSRGQVRVLAWIGNGTPVADPGGRYTVAEGDVVVLDGAGSSDADGDDLTYAWDLDGDGMFDDSTEASPVFSAVEIDGPDSREVSLRVNDGLSDSAVATTTVQIENVAPGVSASAATDTVEENGIATVSGDIVDPGAADSLEVTIDWGDGTVETLAYPPGSSSYTATHQYLDDDPSGTPADDYTVTVSARDDDGGAGGAARATVGVHNVDPVITRMSSSDPSGLSAQEGEALRVSGQFTDVGTADTHEVTIDWGDGTQTEGGVTQGADVGSFTGSHEYSSIGVYRVTATVTDDDTGRASATGTAVVGGVGLSHGVLEVIGTGHDDRVDVRLRQNRIMVKTDFADPMTRYFAPGKVRRLRVRTFGGDDRIRIHHRVAVPATLDGGSGTDTCIRRDNDSVRNCERTVTQHG